MAKRNSFCLTALVIGLTCLAVAASLPTAKVSDSDNGILSKVETWVVEGKTQEEVFPQDEGYDEIRGPEPQPAKRGKRDVHDEGTIMNNRAKTHAARIRRDFRRSSAEGPQYAVNAALSDALRRKIDSETAKAIGKGELNNENDDDDDDDDNNGYGDHDDDDDDDEDGEDSKKKISKRDIFNTFSKEGSGGGKSIWPIFRLL